MKANKQSVAVTSRSFSRNAILRRELLQRYKDVKFNDEGRRLVGEELIEFLRGHDKAITALEQINDEVFNKVPELKTVSKYGIGLDTIDLDAMAKHKIKLAWCADSNRRSVSELALAFMLSLLRHVPAANSHIQQGEWHPLPGRQLSRKTVGIIGCGNIGKDLAMLLRTFECKILAYDIENYFAFYTSHGIYPVGLSDLLKCSDIVTLHLPLNDSTRQILARKRLNMMKDNAILINTARGDLVDETHLKHLLKEGKLAGAAFDVFACEPPEDEELLKLPNFIATPHIGGNSEEAILAMGRAAIKGLDNAKVPRP